MSIKKLLVLLFIPMLTLACALSQTTVNVAVGMEPEAGTPPSAPSVPEQQTCRVSALKSLNLRKDAGTYAEVIGALSNGQTVAILSSSPTSAWLHVRVGDQEGWIHSKYCQQGQ